MPIRATAEFPTVVGENRLYGSPVLFKGGQDVVIEQLHGGHRQLVGIQPSPGVAAVAVDGRLHVDPSHPFEGVPT